MMRVFSPWKLANIINQGFFLPSLRASLPAYHWFHIWWVAARRGYRVFPCTSLPLGGWCWGGGRGGGKQGKESYPCLRIKLQDLTDTNFPSLKCLSLPLCIVKEWTKRTLKNHPLGNLESPLLSTRQRLEQWVQEPFSKLHPKARVQ